MFGFAGANFAWRRVRETERSQYFPSGPSENEDEGRGTRGNGPQEWTCFLKMLKGETRQPDGTQPGGPGETMDVGQGNRRRGSQEWANFLRGLKEHGVRTWQPHRTATRSRNEL